MGCFPSKEVTFVPEEAKNHSDRAPGDTQSKVAQETSIAASPANPNPSVASPGNGAGYVVDNQQMYLQQQQFMFQEQQQQQQQRQLQQGYNQNPNLSNQNFNMVDNRGGNNNVGVGIGQNNQFIIQNAAYMKYQEDEAARRASEAQQQQQQQSGGGGHGGNQQHMHQTEEDEEADDSFEDGQGQDPSSQPPELQAYSYQDLVAASDGFLENSVLGEGGFGKVYKGFVLDQFPVGGGPPVSAPVAIKKLNPSGYQSKVEWMREILVLGKLQHPNLVRLIGYCAELEEMLLVYEYVPRGSLDYHLWPAPNSEVDPLTWQARLRIAHDAACGLAHLHASNFIHRDFKAPNILIAEDYAGKLTDFGLAKDGPDAGQTHVSTQIMGTMGYLDPRYAETGQLTVKSDVYAYGVVLLELLTGKKAMGISPGGKPKTLTAWARPLLNKGRPDLESLVDPNLIDPFPEKVARTLAISAKHCIQDDTNMRPMMSDIVDTLRPLNMAINGRR